MRVSASCIFLPNIAGSIAVRIAALNRRWIHYAYLKHGSWQPLRLGLLQDAISLGYLVCPVSARRSTGPSLGRAPISDREFLLIRWSGVHFPFCISTHSHWGGPSACLKRNLGKQGHMYYSSHQSHCWTCWLYLAHGLGHISQCPWPAQISFTFDLMHSVPNSHVRFSTLASLKRDLALW